MGKGLAGCTLAPLHSFCPGHRGPWSSCCCPSKFGACLGLKAVPVLLGCRASARETMGTAHPLWCYGHPPLTPAQMARSCCDIVPMSLDTFPCSKGTHAPHPLDLRTWSTKNWRCSSMPPLAGLKRGGWIEGLSIAVTAKEQVVPWCFPLIRAGFPWSTPRREGEPSTSGTVGPHDPPHMHTPRRGCTFILHPLCSSRGALGMQWND